MKYDYYYNEGKNKKLFIKKMVTTIKSYNHFLFKLPLLGSNQGPHD